MEILIPVLIVLSVIAVTILLQPKKRKSTTQRQRATPLPDLTKVTRTKVNQKLKHELITMLSGNIETANRLMKHQQSLNPNKSLDWCLEKVIADLKRDRYRR
jgi:hypothetical protein